MLKFTLILISIAAVWGVKVTRVIPYHVSIRNHTQHLCSGTIINNKWVLTVAQCVYRIEATKLKISVGTTDITETKHTYPIVSKIVHEIYRPGRFHYSFALLKVKGSIEFNKNVSAIALPDKPTNVESIVYASGWMLKGDKRKSNTLQVIREEVISDEACRKRFEFTLPKTIFCADYVDGTASDDAFRDIGGPVVKNKKVVGLVVYLLNPDLKLPGLSAKVSSVVDWIKSNAK